MKPQHVQGTRAIALPDNKKVRRVFPHARELPRAKGKYVFVRHGVPETRFLRRLGANIPCPMATHYQWPRKPWDAQQTTASLLVLNKRAYVLNEMGTGKTFAALAAADFLLQEKQIERALIVAPLSTLGPTWQQEILQWFPHRTYAILHGAAAKRRELLEQRCDFYVINHAGVDVLLDILRFRSDIQLVILDELAVYRSPKTKRWKNMRKLLTGREYVWGMTGAPCPNAPTDAWAQCQLVRPELITPWWTSFRAETMTRVPGSLYNWVQKPDAMDKVHTVMQPAVRFSLEDCQDMPPVIEEMRQVTMSKAQQDAYDEIMDTLGSQIKINDKDGAAAYIDSVNEAVQINKLMQVVSGWVYDADKATVCLDPAPRLNELLDVIQEASRKVIVFVPYEHAVTGVVDFLTHKKIDVGVIRSSMSASKRSQIFSAFQNTPKYRTLVAHPGTMSHGLNLTAANTIVWYAPIHSLDTYIQANRRITRPGQKHTQVLVHLTGSRVEGRVYARLRRKEKLLGVLLSLFERHNGENDG